MGGYGDARLEPLASAFSPSRMLKGTPKFGRLCVPLGRDSLQEGSIQEAVEGTAVSNALTGCTEKPAPF